MSEEQTTEQEQAAPTVEERQAALQQQALLARSGFGQYPAWTAGSQSDDGGIDEDIDNEAAQISREETVASLQQQITEAVAAGDYERSFALRSQYTDLVNAEKRRVAEAVARGGAGQGHHGWDGR